MLELDFTAGDDLLRAAGLDRAGLERVVHGALDYLAAGRPDLCISLVDDRQSGLYHDRTHGDPRPTDVISVEFGAGEGPLGEVVANVEQALRVAAQRGVRPERELALYVVHGILHLFGYDDLDSAERLRMRRAEQAVLERLGFEADPAPHDSES